MCSLSCSRQTDVIGKLIIEKFLMPSLFPTYILIWQPVKQKQLVNRNQAKDLLASCSISPTRQVYTGYPCRSNTSLLTS